MSRFSVRIRNVLFLIALLSLVSGPGLLGAIQAAGSTPVTGAVTECPITLPNNVVPPKHLEHYVGEGGKYAYFEDGMWVGIGERAYYHDTERFLGRDGSIGIKHWFTRGDGVVGKVIVTGERLDREAPPLSQDDPERQYGTTGFTPLGIIYPTAGCWEITGTVGDYSITWVEFLEEPNISGTPAA